MTTSITPLLIALEAAGLSIAACATPGTRPLDMSASEHDSAATAAEASAYEHASRAGQAHTDVDWCKPSVPCRLAPGGAPIDQEKQQAQRLLWIAAEHRKGAQALRDEEAVACRGVRDRDLALNLFEDRRRIERVEPLRIGSSHFATSRLAGSIITFAAGDELNTKELEHLLGCHVGRAAVLGAHAPETLRSPLMVHGARFEVRSASGRLEVEIRADDWHAGAEILRRARALVGATSSEPVQRPADPA